MLNNLAPEQLTPAQRWMILFSSSFGGFFVTFMISGIRFDKIFLIGRLLQNLPTWILHGMGVNFYFGGTSLLIVVGVAMDTVNQIESQLIMRHYDGFSPRSGRIRGRKTW